MISGCTENKIAIGLLPVAKSLLDCSEATIQRCSVEKVFRKYAANLQEDTHAEV